MKHSLHITLYLIGLFILSQIMGLYIINQYIDYSLVIETQEEAFKDLPFNFERPEIDQQYSFTYIFIGIIIGTVLLLLLIRFKKVRVWKLWYFLSVLLTLSIALAAFVDSIIAFIIAVIVSSIKVFKSNLVIHNFSEIFIYGGLGAIFVPVINIFAAIMLLLLISLYDMYAVWKSKHMITLAKFQSKSNVFAGLYMPYDKKPLQVNRKTKIKIKKGEKKLREQKIAMLGGGDIGFPLIFSGVIMKKIIITHLGILGFMYSLIIPLFCAISLGCLFMLSKKNKFYPAMPFLSMGCFVGYGALLIFSII